MIHSYQRNISSSSCLYLEWNHRVRRGWPVCSILVVLGRLGTWLGHPGHSSRCAAQCLVLESQGGDWKGGGRGSERGDESCALPPVVLGSCIAARRCIVEFV